MMCFYITITASKRKYSAFANMFQPLSCCVCPSQIGSVQFSYWYFFAIIFVAVNCFSIRQDRVFALTLFKFLMPGMCKSFLMPRIFKSLQYGINLFIVTIVIVDDIYFIVLLEMLQHLLVNIHTHSLIV